MRAKYLCKDSKKFLIMFYDELQLSYGVMPIIGIKDPYKGYMILPLDEWKVRGYELCREDS